jgi:hypothetical protein
VGVVMFHRSSSASALLVAPNPIHALNSRPLPFFSPGITIKGALTVRFSAQTLFGG